MLLPTLLDAFGLWNGHISTHDGALISRKVDHIESDLMWPGLFSIFSSGAKLRSIFCATYMTRKPTFAADNTLSP